MFVSKISNNNTNFGTCIPVCKVFARCNDGSVHIVPDTKIPGLTTALVRRLKNTNSREAIFFRENVDTFSNALETVNGELAHKVASTSVGPTDRIIRSQGEKTHVIFGDDINLMDAWFRQYNFGNLSKEHWIWNICEQIIKPIANRGKNISTKGRVKLFLYADKIGKKYKLNGLSFADESGNVIKTLQPEAPKPKMSTKKINTNKRLQMSDDDFSAYNQYLDEKKLVAREKEYQKRLEAQEPELLSDDPFYDN